jgi:putative transposase
MRQAKVQPEDYVQFLLASPRQFSCAEAARVQPPGAAPPAHDAFTRLLTRLEPDPEALWQEARAQVRCDDGVVILDDSTLDKPYAWKVGLVGWHWSGKHHRAVKGINLLTLLWTDGDRHVPCDYRLYDKPHDGLTKNDLFADLLRQAHRRGLRPHCVCFDSWFSGLANLKLIRSLGWAWLCRLKCNRTVRVDFGQPQAIATVSIPAAGRVVHLPGYGPIRVFRAVATNGDAEYWATGELPMGALTRQKYKEFSWRIETCQADYPSRRRWVGTWRIGYHRRDGVARVGRVVPATPGRLHRRSRMSDPTRRPTPPRAATRPQPR